jgi:hypothetical protein
MAEFYGGIAIAAADQNDLPNATSFARRAASRALEAHPEWEEPAPVEHDEDDPYPNRVMVDAAGRPHYEP